MRRISIAALAAIAAACGDSASSNITADAPLAADARPVDGGGAAIDARAVDATATDGRAIDGATGGNTPDAPAGNTPDAPAGNTPDAPTGNTPDAPIDMTPDAAPGTPDAPAASTPDAATPDAPPPVVTTMRVVTLAALDPHAVLGASCIDLTGSLNGLIKDAVDDFSLNLLMRFKPLAPGDGVVTPVEIVLGDCDANGCTAGGGQRYDSQVTSQTSGTCLAPVPDTLTSGEAYTATGVTPVTAGDDGCFFSDAETIQVSFSGITLELADARLAARYSVGDGGHDLVSGLVRGFVSEEAAAQVQVPIFGSLAGLLWGGQGNECKPGKGDKDTGPGGASGWYFYFAFTADVVEFSGD